ncbi:hypothetical protein D3C78_1445430 [compost metagenome]
MHTKLKSTILTSSPQVESITGANKANTMLTTLKLFTYCNSLHGKTTRKPTPSLHSL